MSDGKNTFFLVPRHEYLPDDQIKLGNIILKPSKPHKNISSFRVEDGNIITLDDEEDYNFSDDKARSDNGGIVARFVHFARTSVNAAKVRTESRRYFTERLETVRLRDIPNQEQLRPYLNEKNVKDALKAGIFQRLPPLYLVSGLKIAHGLRWCEGKDHAVCFGADAGATVAPDGQASARGAVRRDRYDCQHNSSRITGPRIFGYELQIIRVKKNSIEIEGVTKGALLHDSETASDASDASSELEAEDIEVAAVQVEDSAVNLEEDRFEAFDQEDGGVWVLDME